MSGLLGKIPKFTLKLPASLARVGRTMSECPLELSFSLCEESGCRKTKNEEISQVNLPSELKYPQLMERHETREKADEEKSEKEDNMEVTCSVSVDGQEKQEFSFTLYDFDTKEKASKQDVEKIVVRSICEALGKTLKLPPSGSRTIKVELAISPDSSKEDTSELVTEAQKWPAETSKQQDYDSSKSANTASTYLPSSSVEKPPSPHGCFSASTQLAANASGQQNALISMPSPKLRPMRHNRLVSLQKQELKCSTKDHHKKSVDGNNHDNRVPVNEVTKASDEPIRCQNPQHLSSRVHVPESRERRNHYLDLAGIENNAPHNSDSLQKLYSAASVNPNYVCPYKILDRSHVCSKSHRPKEVSESPYKKSAVPAKDSVGQANVSNGYKARLDSSNQDDLLNLNLDICDITPDVKFDWERIYHRRSKSYDLHESGVHASASLYSPKLKPRQNRNATFSPEAVRNPSLAHHFRFRHRDKERQRAMQQVANWIAQEHVKDQEQERTHILCKKLIKPSQNGCTEKHEHHHHHEHIHHHYHHFLEF